MRMYKEDELGAVGPVHDWATRSKSNSSSHLPHEATWRQNQGRRFKVGRYSRDDAISQWKGVGRANATRVN